MNNMPYYTAEEVARIVENYRTYSLELEFQFGEDGSIPGQMSAFSTSIEAAQQIPLQIRELLGIDVMIKTLESLVLKRNGNKPRV